MRSSEPSLDSSASLTESGRCGTTWVSLSLIPRFVSLAATADLPLSTSRFAWPSTRVTTRLASSLRTGQCCMRPREASIARSRSEAGTAKVMILAVATMLRGATLERLGNVASRDRRIDCIQFTDRRGIKTHNAR